MRLLIIVLSILLLTAVFGFVVTNLDATVGVTVTSSPRPVSGLFFELGGAGYAEEEEQTQRSI